MFKIIDGLPDHVIGVDVSGKITAEDYTTHFIPLVEEKMRVHKRLDILCRIEKGWNGIEPGAMWQDLRLGMSNLGSWGRIAVVTDRDWLENAINMFKMFWPGHLRHFEFDDYERAREWVCEQNRASVRCNIDNAAGIVVVEPNPDKSLSEYDFEYIVKTVDGYLADNQTVQGLLISARQFPGWQSMGAMLSHLKFVQEHHRKIKRIALVTDSPLGKFADHAVDHFVKAEIRSFGFDEANKAKDWLKTK